MIPANPSVPSRRRERIALCAAALLVLATGAAVAGTLASVQYVQLADEGYYRSYASRIAENGPGAFPDTFEAYLAEPRHWRFPNPLRVGYIAVAAGWSRVRGDTFRALSEISLVSHCLLIAVCFGFVRRLANDPLALATSALVACSPLLLGLSRRALLDSPATLLALASLWAFWECLRAPARRGPRVALMLCFGLGMLVKETTVLLGVPFALLLATSPAPVRRAALPALVPALLAPPVICAFVWLLAAGDAGRLFSVVQIILQSPESNPYAQRLGGGPWWRYAVDLLLLSPAPTALALAVSGHALFEARAGRSDPARRWFALFALGLLLAYAPFTKNVRYVAPIELPLRALAAIGLFALCGSRAGWRRGAAVAAAVAVLCWLDWRHFDRVFVRGGLDDPVSAALLQARGLIPGPAPPP